MAARKNKLHPIRQRAIDNVWRYGLTTRQIRVINVLDRYSRKNPEGPSIHQVARMARISYGAAWVDLGVADHFGYAEIDRDHKGRAYRHGIRFIHGFKLDELDEDEEW